MEAIFKAKKEMEIKIAPYYHSNNRMSLDQMWKEVEKVSKKYNVNIRELVAVQ